MVQASKSEALLAVDLYNRPTDWRPYEGFIVHMHIAWTYLLHAGFARSGIDYRYWNSQHTRLIKVDGEPKTWDLAECAKNRWPGQNPVRKNIEFFIGLRNRIEHRSGDAIALATGGHAQAHLLNYEEELVSEFEQKESIGNELRFPVFVHSFTPYGEEALREAQRRLPARTLDYMATFHADLDADVRDDRRFEFRLRLVPWIGPKTQADLAVQFVRLDELTADERTTLAQLGRTGKVIVRERIRGVVHHGRMKPGDVVAEVQEEIPWAFSMWHFVHAWRHYAVRPPSSSAHPDHADERYCIYDETHRDYVYTPAFAQKLIRNLQTEESFREIYDRDPDLAD